MYLVTACKPYHADLSLVEVELQQGTSTTSLITSQLQATRRQWLDDKGNKAGLHLGASLPAPTLARLEADPLPPAAPAFEFKQARGTSGASKGYCAGDQHKDGVIVGYFKEFAEDRAKPVIIPTAFLAGLGESFNARNAYAKNQAAVGNAVLPRIPDTWFTAVVKLAKEGPSSFEPKALNKLCRELHALTTPTSELYAGQLEDLSQNTVWQKMVYAEARITENQRIKLFTAAMKHQLGKDWELVVVGKGAGSTAINYDPTPSKYDALIVSPEGGVATVEITGSAFTSFLQEANNATPLRGAQNIASAKELTGESELAAQVKRSFYFVQTEKLHATQSRDNQPPSSDGVALVFATPDIRTIEDVLDPINAKRHKIGLAGSVAQPNVRYKGAAADTFNFSMNQTSFTALTKKDPELISMTKLLRRLELCCRNRECGLSQQAVLTMAHIDANAVGANRRLLSALIPKQQELARG